MSDYFTGFQLLDRAIENFDQVWPILNKMSPVSDDLIFDLAYKEHFRLLQNNYPDFLYGKRVATIKTLENHFNRGISLIRAADTAKILDTIQEGETWVYCGVEITKKDGTIISKELRKDQDE